MVQRRTLPDRGSLDIRVAAVTKQGVVLEDLTQQVKGFTYTDSEKGIDKAEFQVNNFDLSSFSRTESMRWQAGRFVRVSFGYQGEIAVVANLKITKVRGSTNLMVKARNTGDTIARSKVTKTWKNTTRAAVARAIARKHGIPIAFIEEDGVRYDRITQSRETDAAFLRRLAYKQGFKFSIHQDGMTWASRRLDKRPRTELVYHLSPRGDILGFDLDRDITRLPARVTAKAVDRKTGQEVSFTADNSTDTERDLLTAAVGYIVTEGADTALSFDVEEEIIKSAKPEDVERDAKARFRLAQQRSIKFSLRIIGNPRIRPREVIKLTGFGDILSGLYYVKKVVSEVSRSSGYVATIHVTTDGVNRTSQRSQDSGAAVWDCIGAVSAAINFIGKSSNAFNEANLFLRALEDANRAGRAPSKRDLKALINRAAYLITNLNAIGEDDVAFTIGQCHATLSALVEDSDEEEEARGKLNASFPPDEDEAEPVLFLENEGEIAGTIDTEFVGPVPEGEITQRYRK